MRQKIEPQTQTLSLEDVLFAFSKAASANVLVDATHLPTVEIKPFAERNSYTGEQLPSTRVNLPIYITSRGHLSYERSTPDTFVFWHQPDTQKLTALCITAQKKWGDDTWLSETADTIAGLNRFFADTQGWNPVARTIEEKDANAKGIDATWKFKDFPPVVRASMRKEFARQVLTIQYPYPVTYQRFSLDYWKDARVTLGTGTQSVYDKEGRPLGNYQNPLLTIKPKDENGQRIYLFPHTKTLGPLVPQPVPFTQEKASATAIRQYPRETLAADTPPVVPQMGVKLETEPTLRKRVSFAVKSLPLTQFVSQLQKQSGVPLTVDSSLSPNLRVTGCTNSLPGQATFKPSMTLASAMFSLARLFAAHWDKQGAGYILSSDGLDELHLELRQLGYKATYSWPSHSEQETTELEAQVGDEILATTNADSLRSNQGIALSELPTAVQNDILNRVWDNDAPQLILAQQRLEDALVQDIHFRFAPLPKPVPLFFGVFRSASFRPHLRADSTGLVAYSADGRAIVRLYPDLNAAPASPMDKDAKAQSDYWIGAEAYLKQQQQQK